MKELTDKYQLVKQGAEGRLYKGMYLGKPVIVKERFPKKYRHPELDTRLTKDRIKAEVRALSRCKMIGISAPTVFYADISTGCIFMEHITESITIRDYITEVQERHPEELDKLEQLCTNVGLILGKLHANNIIHGDLTTSNMLLQNNLSKFDITLIDFGLSYTEEKAEDKGVDLYVLERAFSSTHPESEEMFSTILQSYKKTNPKALEVLKKLDEIRLRGRKRTMVG